MSDQTQKTTDGYNQQAAQYEERWKGYLTHTHQQFIDELTTTPDDIILDVSCGTGLLAKHLTKASMPFKKMVLNDIAADMQDIARKRFNDRADISFSEQSVRTLHFEDQAFRKVFCLNAFHNYPSQRQVIRNLWHVLQPGGELYLLDWNKSGLFRPVNWMIKQYASERIDTRSLDEMLRLCINAGFTLLKQKEWYFRYWKFLFIKARKPSQ